MADKFKPGERVQLNSGGPIMTVVKYDLYGMAATEKSYLCKWFDSKNAIVENTFTEPELQSAERDANDTGSGREVRSTWG